MTPPDTSDPLDGPDADPFVKRRPDAPPGFFAAEADGLEWLAEPKAVPVVEVLGQDADHLLLERLQSARPSADAAARFGRGLARLHNSGASAFGWAPSETAWFGPLEAPFPVSTDPRESFAEFWAEDRLRPLAEAAEPSLDAETSRAVSGAIQAIASGTFDGIAGEGAEPPSRVHGDLWSGNVMWTPEGAVLIDPAAHGGHRLEDLAMLSLFGAPYLDEIFSAYEDEHPMPATWRDDLPAHLFFGLLAHVVLFGAGYVPQTQMVAERIIERARELG